MQFEECNIAGKNAFLNPHFYSVLHTPPASQYRCPFASKVKEPSTVESERSHCQSNPRRMREDGE
jgi:hypothetical protein